MAKKNREEMAYRQARDGWKRATVNRNVPTGARATFRKGGPSPGEEIIALHDAELDEPVVDLTSEGDADTGTYCF